MSNVITPPDFVRNNFKSVLLVDPTPEELEAVVVFCSGSKQDLNIYVYLEDMKDTTWLLNAASISSTVIVNTVPNSISMLKDRISTTEKSYYYGPRNFLMNPRRVRAPVEVLALDEVV